MEEVVQVKWNLPVQMAEFAVAQGIDHELAFNWWVKDVLKRRHRIIASIRMQQTRYLKKSHKFCIELPKTVKQALAMGRCNIQRNGECYSGFWSLTIWEVSTPRPPICAVPYGLQYHSGGFQMKGQDYDRRPHDQSTGYCYVCQHIERDS